MCSSYLVTVMTGLLSQPTSANEVIRWYPVLASLTRIDVFILLIQQDFPTDQTYSVFPDAYLGYNVGCESFCGGCTGPMFIFVLLRPAAPQCNIEVGNPALHMFHILVIFCSVD